MLNTSHHGATTYTPIHTTPRHDGRPPRHPFGESNIVPKLPMSLTGQHLAREHVASMPQRSSYTHLRDQQSHIESQSDAKPLCLSDSDDMILPQHNTSSVTKPPLAMPAKSTVRASKMLDVNIHMVALQEQPPFAQTTLHDAYFSAEEDASASVDDFSDLDLDPSNSQRSGNRRSHENAARVVSVIFAGKPSIVELPLRPISPSSNGFNSRPPKRLRRTCTEPVLTGRCTSISSSASSPILHPHRTSSMGPRKLEKQQPQFLHIDPFAAKPELEEREVHDSAQTPKTPAGAFKRTLSLARKKSKPALNNYAAQSRDNLTLSIPTHHMKQVQKVQEEPLTQDWQAPAPKGPATYQEITKSAKRAAPNKPMFPMSPISNPSSPVKPTVTRNRLRQGFSAARRRSIKD
ncbi:hypothetical protein EDB81DRAFT_826788 [Dactylonectria macrodidyma]|uniref:Uncharacterized protein n=1 Tax=Dactylonectria macrodidyma TaxID=307937 RepID=A0A9P9IAK5_9HYPO|nr:hypothetical protein EDB81DRAFT_826788 [Dactylonectria macrodidyma]